MLCNPLARPCMGKAKSCTGQIPRKAIAAARPSNRCQDSSLPAASQQKGSSENQTRAPPTLRHVLLALSVAAASDHALPCQAIVEEKLTGSPAYSPSQTELGWEIIVGAVAATIPLIVASYEFGKRILIQRRCPDCKGSGLIQRGRYMRKCSNCGGFLPWQGWKTFFLSTAAPGNGGPLRQPRGQTGIFYKVPPRQLEQEAEERQKARSPPTPAPARNDPADSQQ